MNIVTNNPSLVHTGRPEIEQMEREKQEYKLIGRFLRRKGLNLYAYDPKEDKIRLVKIKTKPDLNISVHENKLVPKDTAPEEAMVDARMEHFEALNIKSATRRVEKFKAGKIAVLNNLIVPGNGISFW